jgi:hypothetical protein
LTLKIKELFSIGINQSLGRNGSKPFGMTIDPNVEFQRPTAAKSIGPYITAAREKKGT